MDSLSGQTVLILPLFGPLHPGRDSWLFPDVRRPGLRRQAEGRPLTAPHGRSEGGGECRRGLQTVSDVSPARSCGSSLTAGPAVATAA